MLDFTVPSNPGWGKRTLEASGSEEEEIGAISPKMRLAIDTLQEQNRTLSSQVFISHTAVRVVEEVVSLGSDDDRPYQDFVASRAEALSVREERITEGVRREEVTIENSDLEGVYYEMNS